MANPPSDPHRDEPTPQPEEGLRVEADPGVARPQQEEPNGPVPGLLATAAASASAEVGLAGEEALEQLEATGVEEEGIASAQIVGITAAILVTVALMSFVVFWAFYLPELGQSEDQAADRVEIGTDQRTILAEGMGALENYALTADSTYTIPIDVAMMQVVEDNAAPAATDAVEGSTESMGAPSAVTRQEFNVRPVTNFTPGATRPATGTTASPASGDAQVGSSEMVTSDELPEADLPETNLNE